MCTVTIIFAAPILALLFGDAYTPGAGALQIFVTGMVFFTIYNISSSICQGLGRPFIPMLALIVGTTVELILSVLLIPSIGIEGAATGTTVAAFIIMIITLYGTFKLSKVNIPVADFTRIIMASFLMGVILMLLPKTIEGFLMSIILAPLLYALFIAVVGGLRKDDIAVMYRFAGKFGPAAGILRKLIGSLERFTR
jgi:stage V sporulation protein B